MGAPHPRVREQMEREHTDAGGDRHELFTTANFGVTTSSATEWAFVVEPESRPANEWPVEGKLVVHIDKGGSNARERWDNVRLVASERQKRRRQPMPMAELERRVAERGFQLRKLEEPPVTMEEAIGARLYTGPMVCDCSVSTPRVFAVPHPSSRDES